MDLKDIYIFKNLSDDNLKTLERFSYEKPFKKGEILFYEGEEPEYLYILTEGIVRIFKTDFKGHEITLHHFYPVSVIAELANFERQNYPATAEFETDGKVLAIDFDMFEKELLRNPTLAYEVMKSLIYKIKILDNVIVQNLMMDAVSRVAKFIYEHEDLFITLKHNKIASILNITPETLSRILKKFREKNILVKEKSGYKIVNREALKNFF